MVRINLLLTFLMVSVSMFAQKDTIEDISFMVIDQAPCYSSSVKGQDFYGENKLKKFIADNLNYSLINKTDSIKETVYISFWIDTIGNTYDHKVIRGLTEDLDNEALRVAKMIKFEKPAMQKGKPIKIKYVIPVKFKLSPHDCGEKRDHGK
jgi:TonB family protein